MVKINQDYDRTKIRKTEKLAKYWGTVIKDGFSLIWKSFDHFQQHIL